MPSEFDLKKIVFLTSCVALCVAFSPNIASAKAKKFDPKKFLSGGVWRVDGCERQDYFQAFDFKARPPIVEVGAGNLGDGEKVQILSVAQIGAKVEVRTTVCAPIGCNKTWEQYKILSEDMMQEWIFEGHLPNQAPNIVVKDGVAFDGSKGRIFKKCKA